MAEVDEMTGEVLDFGYRHSAELNELFTALNKAQAVFESAEKSGLNPHFRSKYATLESVLEATKKGRAENGLAIIQMPTNYRNAIGVITLLGHVSGQWIQSTVSVPPVRLDAQSAGSIVTYLRRYSLMSVLGIPAADDDADAAVQPAAASGAGQVKEPTPTPLPPQRGRPPRPTPAPPAAKPAAPPQPDEGPDRGAPEMEKIVALASKIEEARVDPGIIFRQFKVERLEDLRDEDIATVDKILDNRLMQMKKSGQLKLSE